MISTICIFIYHVEEIAYLGSFGQIPHVDVAIMASRQHYAGVKRVSLHHEHLVIMTLKKTEHQYSVSMSKAI